MANGPSTQSVEVLGSRVSTLERQVSAVDNKIDLLGNKMDAQLGAILDRIAQSRVPPWQTIFGGLSLMVVVFGAVWATGISPIDRALASLSAESKGFVRSEDLDYRLKVDGARRDEQYADLKGRIAETERLRREDAARVVPRGEHERVWQSEAAAIASIQRQIDDVKQAQGSTYGVRDVIQRLEKQVEDLRDQARAGR